MQKPQHGSLHDTLAFPRHTRADYLLHWGTTPDQLRRELDAITKASVHLISSIHAIGAGNEQDPDSDMVV